MNLDWSRLKAVVLQSDDWGLCAWSPDEPARQALAATPAFRSIVAGLIGGIMACVISGCAMERPQGSRQRELVLVAQSSASAKVKQDACDALGALGDTSAIGPLIEFLADPDLEQWLPFAASRGQATCGMSVTCIDPCILIQVLG